MTTVLLANHCPDSTYAAWTKLRREAADRLERQYNDEIRRQRAEQAPSNHIPLVGDDSLRQFNTQFRRQLEDIASGDLPGGEKRARVVRGKLARIGLEQNSRTALAESWLAHEDGTDDYSMFEARGGLKAVRDHGATAPTFQLAARLDRLNFDRGMPHVLQWKN